MRDDGEGPLIEPFACPPLFCSGLASAEVRAGMLHMTWYYESVGPDGTAERVVNCRIVIPLPMRASALATVEAALAKKPVRRRLDA